MEYKEEAKYRRDPIGARRYDQALEIVHAMVAQTRPVCPD